MPLRLLIVDDSFLIREGLRQLLSLSPRVEVLAALPDPVALLAALEHLAADVVLTDIRMPPSHTDEGVRLAEQLQRTHPDLGVVVLSQHGQAHYAARLLAQGAGRRGYLLKDRIHDLDHLVSTLEGVAAGECRVDPQLVEALLATCRPRPAQRIEALTPRQLEILAALAAGLSNAALAQRFGLSLRAVEKHVSEIFGRLGIANDDSISRRVHATLMYLSETEV